MSPKGFLCSSFPTGVDICDLKTLADIRRNIMFQCGAILFDLTTPNCASGMDSMAPKTLLLYSDPPELLSAPGTSQLNHHEFALAKIMQNELLMFSQVLEER